MPIWLPLYFLAYIAFTIYWVRDHIRDKINIWLILFCIIGDACLIISALGFWLQDLHQFRGIGAMIVFTIGTATLATEAIQEFRALFKDPENSTLFNIGVVAFVTLVLVPLCGPMLYWGFSFSVLGIQSGT